MSWSKHLFFPPGLKGLTYKETTVKIFKKGPHMSFAERLKSCAAYIIMAVTRCDSLAKTKQSEQAKIWGKQLAIWNSTKFKQDSTNVSDVTVTTAIRRKNLLGVSRPPIPLEQFRIVHGKVSCWSSFPNACSSNEYIKVDINQLRVSKS
jgi:hypothetical protein